jgi:hypothetical protein
MKDHEQWHPLLQWLDVPKQQAGTLYQQQDNIGMVAGSGH